MFEIELSQWKEKYSELDFSFIPLKPGTKFPLDNFSWTKNTTEVLWGFAPANANIGIRCGGKANLLVIDCDNKKSPETFDNITRYFSGLGINPNQYPIVQTASGIGRHVYLKCNNAK